MGVSLGPVVINGCYPALAGLHADPTEAAVEAATTLRPGEKKSLLGAAQFRRERMALQREQVARLAEALPLPQLRLPYLFDAELGPDQLDLLASSLLAGIEGLDAAPAAEGTA